MSKHIIDKAKDTAIEWSNSAKKLYRIGKSRLKKFADSYSEKVQTADAKADERVKKKNWAFSTSTPNGTLRRSSNPRATKNGGTL